MSITINVIVLLATFCFALPNLSLAKEHIVGDASGWTLNFDYSEWAQGKEFRVGDTLVFNYPMKKHNVLKVTGPQFLQCNVPAGAEAMITGHDVINLASPGRKWYVCGIGHHCQMGMRLVINVLASEWQLAPSPSVAWSPFVLPIPLPSSPPSLPPAWEYPQVPAAARSPSPSSSSYFSSHLISMSPAMSPMGSPSVPPVAAAPAAEPYTFFNRFLKK